MNLIEQICYWTAALLSAAAFFTSLLGTVFKRVKPFRFAGSFLTGALGVLTAFGVARWVRVGHPPFVTLFESMITSIWFLLLLHQIIFRLRREQGTVLLLPVSAVVFLLMGWAFSLPAEATPLSAALSNVWLFIHASFATSGAASFLIAASLSVIYLLGEKRSHPPQANSAPPETLAPLKTILNFLIFGLILWGVMIASGSIWAHVAWGRYWAWDPIELWSLISWLVYALLIHVRLTVKFSPRWFCRLNIIAVAIVLFALWGVHYVYETIHTYG
ncbi:MAG TPA: cytochrome c biogenesis protein CcsA [Candidatus Deferrimicrobium sp.]|nr:cytochrome c biogenesis protein CcsA [Candidatus Deferrimicrobium sp.]